jgi:hypothetical protein
MSVTLFTLFVDDPKPVLDWLNQYGGVHVVRKQTVQIASGWSMKVALDDPNLSDRFRSHWSDVLVTLDNRRRWIQQGWASAHRGLSRRPAGAE